ncbi:hypothetical protein [Microseira sp. BLCC-F43]|uniref:hypothetical protein n=1 Tax=Microseira sp. BLCC-F43 TaxID=3153602 RepID=UPI0035B6CB5E
MLHNLKIRGGFGGYWVRSGNNPQANRKTRVMGQSLWKTATKLWKKLNGAVETL